MLPEAILKEEKKELAFVGKKIPRVDAKEKVSGRPIYVRDLAPKVCYHAKIVRSTRPHARIKNIDVSEVLKIPGVVDVITADDIPGINFVDAIIPDKPFLAKDEVNYVGEEIAIVVAIDKETAELAAKKVKVEYEDLPFEIDFDIDKIEPNRIICDSRIEKGDVEKGFKEATYVIEETFETGAQEHAYIEPQGVFADASGDIIEIKAATQCPYYVQKNVSKILGVPLHKVKVTATMVGGGFGGKEEDPSWIAALCALASYKVGRPVILDYDREEDMLSTTKRHPSKIRIKIGVDEEGKFTAIEAKVVLDGGAYGTITPAVLFLAVQVVSGPYKWPNVKIYGVAVKTNRPPSGAFRGFGAPQAVFAIESAIDILAEKMGINPIQLRMINGLEGGSKTVTTQKLGDDVGFKESLEIADNISEFSRKRELYTKHNEGRVIKKGIGLAGAWTIIGLGPGGYPEDRGIVYVQFTIDGRLVVNVGVTEMGQGSLTVIKQMAAEIFGMKLEDVEVIIGDTLALLDTGPTVASRTTFVIGNALRDAARKLKPIIFETALEISEKISEPLEIRDSMVFSHDKSVSIPISEITRHAYTKHKMLTAIGWYSPPRTYINEKGLGEPFYAYIFATHVAEVEVDTETGAVKVLNVWAVHDSGKIINPVTASGQVEGGIVQGMGLALFEKFVYENGKMINNNFTDYLIPTIKDAPNIHVRFVEKTSPEGPFGAKGIGEIPLVASIPAIINAISHAIGRRIKKIPATYEDIYFLCRANKK